MRRHDFKRPFQNSCQVPPVGTETQKWMQCVWMGGKLVDRTAVTMSVVTTA